MQAVRRWFWFGFVLLYPFWVSPFDPSLEGVVRAKQILVLMSLLLGLLLELSSHPRLHLRDIVRAPSFLRRHRALILVLFLAFSMGLSTLFSPQPEVALTGSLAHGGDGLLWNLMMLGVFALVYLRTLADPLLGERVAWAIVGGASLLALGALTEILTQKGLYYPVRPESLPMVTFPGKGHLAAYFVLGFGVAAGLALRPRPSWVLLPALFLTALALGLTYNRAGLGGIALAGLLLLWRLPRRGLLVLSLALLGVLSGWEMVGLVHAGGGREVTNPHTFFTRLYFWKAALRGIAERPLWGWGGGVFEGYWSIFLSEQEKAQFLQAEFGIEGYQRSVIGPPAPPLFVVQRGEETALIRVSLFRAHNFLLEFGLRWGLVGLALFLVLLFRVWLWPRWPEAGWGLGLGLLALSAYLVFWFPIAEYEAICYLGLGSFWALGKRS